MPILKCKMCGGDLNILEGMTVCECEYCNTKQTVPSLDDEKKATLFTRANRLRSVCEFDKAFGVYESIVVDYPEESEAYWGLILCKYGIEYVDDPVTTKKIPTCHRSSFESVMDDANFELVLENSDPFSRAVYREEAKAIEELRKGIIAVSSKEEPYDIFICYKETDANGERTLDSVIAQDVYKELTNEGYRVFFSRITLEDKLGQEYEPYIFAALHSAKVMLAFGTDYEYFNAVWVKNEWSRYLQLITQGEKKTLIPCYKGIDAYDMPKEFARLQAQDMGKVGAIQDLLRGIEKIIPKKTEVVKETVVIQSGNGTSVDAMIKRGQIAIEDGDWSAADNYYEQALNINPECAEAYLGKLLVMNRSVSLINYFSGLEEKYSSATVETLYACAEDIDHIASVVEEYVGKGYLDVERIKKLYVFDRSYSSALSCRKNQKRKQQGEIDSDKLLARVRQYATGELKEQVESGLKRLIAIHDDRISEEQEKDEIKVAEIIAGYQKFLVEADNKVIDLQNNAENRRLNYYHSVVNLMEKATSISDYEMVRDKFNELGVYEDAIENAKKCQKIIDELKENNRKDAEIVARKNKKRIGIISGGVVALIIVTIIVAYFINEKVSKDNRYYEAMTIFSRPDPDYEEACAIFESLDGYKDSEVMAVECRYNYAIDLMESGSFEEAIHIFETLDGYKDSEARIVECEHPLAYLQSGDTFEFGEWEGEAIVWLVLEVQDGQMLVITQDAIVQMPFQADGGNRNWKNSSLRAWLNDSFLGLSFSEEESSRIITVETLTYSESTDTELSSNDSLFLLSLSELRQYFPNDEDRFCYFQGDACWWWLRTGRMWGSSYMQHIIQNDGSVDTCGINLPIDGGVRPAMWIDIS